MSSEHGRHCSPFNSLIRLLACSIAHYHQTKKPSLHLDGAFNTLPARSFSSIHAYGSTHTYIVTYTAASAC